MSNKERGAIALLVVGILIFARVYWVYSGRWMQDACPCCDLNAEPLDAARVLAGMPFAFFFRYLWQRTLLRWAKGAEEVEPMTAHQRNVRLFATLMGAGFALFADAYFRTSIGTACPRCDMYRWPFEHVCWLAAFMLGMTVYYFLVLALGRRRKKPLG